MKEDQSIDRWIQDETKQRERQASREFRMTQGKI